MLLKKEIRLIFLLLILVCLLAGILNFALAQEKDEITIGVALAQTGHLSIYADYEIKGIKTAIDEINYYGGVLGKSFKAIVKDTESNPQGALDAVKKLVIINKVPLIIGCQASYNTIAAGEYLNDKGVIQISTSSTSLSIRDLGPYSFSVVGLDDLLGKYQVHFAIYDSSRIEKWGIMVIDSAYGIGIGNVMKEEIEAYGGEVVSYVKYEPNKTDYRAELQKLFIGEPQGILSINWGEMGEVQFKQAYEMGLLDKVENRWYSHFPAQLEQCIPETVEGVKGLDIFYGSSRTENFSNRFKKLHPDTPVNAYAARGYDACWIAALAIGVSGSTESDNILKALPFACSIYKGASSADMSVDNDGMQKTQVYASYIIKNGQLERYEEKLWGLE
jgi:branched-chain amino acid transport system substrate-binding protein